MDLGSKIRRVPDYPKKGILFYDITTLLKDAHAFRFAVDRLVEHYLEKGVKVDKVVSMEARGYIFGAVLAKELGAGFVPMRKPGKLPWKRAIQEYDLEYGKDALEMHTDAVEPGENVLIVDDLLATGGTAKAAIELVERLGGKVGGLSFVIELDFLRGREKLIGHDIFSLVHFAEPA